MASEGEKIGREDERIRLRPLSPEMRYTARSSILNFLHLAPLPLDDEVRVLCSEFENRSDEARASFRSSLSSEDCRTFLSFSWRSAGLAMRDRDAERIRIGAIAIAVVSADQFDFRDVSGSLATVYYASVSIGAQTEKYFHSAARLADAVTANMFVRFLDVQSKSSGPRSLGWATVQSRFGPTMVRQGPAAYRATVALDKIALDIAELADGDKYLPSVELGQHLPSIWLKGGGDGLNYRILRDVRAGVLVSGTLHELGCRSSRIGGAQQLWIYVVEAGTKADADALCCFVDTKRAEMLAASLMSIKAGCLFCLLVARSVVQGTPPSESPSSVKRFEPGIRSILSRYQSAEPHGGSARS